MKCDVQNKLVPRAVMELFSVLLYRREVPVSNFGPNNCFCVFLRFPNPTKRNLRLHLNQATDVPSAFPRITYCVIILFFDAVNIRYIHEHKNRYFFFTLPY